MTSREKEKNQTLKHQTDAPVNTRSAAEHHPEQRILWYRTRKARVVMVIISIIAFISMVVWFFAFRPYVSTDDARITAPTIRVSNRGGSGLIERIRVTEGSRIDAGEILAELDHRTAEAQYDKAKARATLANTERRRMESLASQQGTSQQQLDRARSDAAIADAEFRLAELALEFTYLRSPANGIVIQKPAEVGNILETNQCAITVADIDNAWVTANIEETSISLVKPGQKVTVSIDEGGTLTGKVSEVRKASASTFSLIPSDNASGNFVKVVQRIPVKITLDPHPGKTLRVGQSVEIRIRVR